VALDGREIRDRYIPRSQRRDWAAPFDSDDELFETLHRLAGLVHLVALLCLYAVFSVKEPAEIDHDDRWPNLSDDVVFNRSVVLEVAIGEMQHLRWANQLLAGVAETIGKPYEPAVVPPPLFLPDDHGGWNQPAVLEPLTLAVLQTFVDVERSSATSTGSTPGSPRRCGRTAFPAPCTSSRRTSPRRVRSISCTSVTCSRTRRSTLRAGFVDSRCGRRCDIRSADRRG
jgi:hypothetical protein